MNDIEALAKRIILIGNGKILYDGNIKTLKVKYGSYKNIKIFTKDKIDNIKVKGIIKKCKKEDYYNQTHPVSSGQASEAKPAGSTQTDK